MEMKAETIFRNKNGITSHVYPAHIIEKIVADIESEQLNIKDAIVHYGVTRSTLKKWIRTYGKGDTIPDAYRHSTTLYKRQIVNEIETGKLTFLEALKKYKVSESTLYNWRKKYSNDIVRAKPTGNMEKSEKSSHDPVEYQQLEDLKLKIIALETMIDIAEKEFNIPIRKKCGSKQ